MTVRPRSGLTDDMIKRAVSCFDKLDGAFAVTEKTGSERHLHAAMFLKNEVKKCQIVERMKVVQGQLDADELRVLKGGVKVLYSDDWVKQYLDKQDSTVIVYDRLPKETGSYYPDAESQAGAVGRAGATSQSLTTLFTKSERDVTLGNCLDFLREIWFTQRSVPPPRTEGMQYEEAKKLFLFLSLT